MHQVMLGQKVLEYIENWPEEDCLDFFTFLDHIAEDPIPRTYDGGGSNSPDIHYRITPYNFLYTVNLMISHIDGKKLMSVSGIEPRTRFSRFV